MIKKSLPITILIILAVVPWITPALGDIRLPAMFSNHMVIQREMLIPVWGWADPDEKVSVTLCGRTVSTIANSNGKWTLQTGPFTAGGPFELTITGKNTIVIQDVLVGEVWFCSGQSNMQATLGGTKNSQKEIAAADYPKMRTFVVAHNVSPEPLDECRGSWRVCSPKTGRSFTAVGYFFGRELMRELDVPVGLINSSWGSTPAESWTSRKGLVADERLAPILQRFDQAVAELPEKIGEYNKARDEWFDGVFPRDKMSKGFNAGWHKPDFDAEIWKEMKLPSLIENAGLEMNGTLWFRKEVDIPKEWENKDLLMHLGTILDFDVTYLNGIRVGETGYIQGMGFYSPAASRTTLRRYRIPGSLIKQGKSVISVHIMNYISFGGFGRGQGGIMRLVPADDEQAEPVSLEGIWKYAVESNMTPQEIGEIWNKRPRPPVDGYDFQAPMTLYNAMISPLITYAIRGVIWYQGESNVDRGYQYRFLFPSLITDWRKKWGQGDFPFYFVQLANFMMAPKQPEENAWAELRESQLMTLSLPNTGMAVAIDVGDANDIHPKNKQDVGFRLALNALAKVYGREIVYSGPIYESMQVEENSIRLKFKHVGSGLVAKDGELKQFAIAGEDRKFVWAQARIDGNTVLVSSETVPQPTAVRYAWAGNPEGCNLYNKEGLPASPFRTDTWQLTTQDKR